MGITDYPLTKEEFSSIYSKVPRLNVELIIKSDKGILLTLRDIEPCKGQWHIPGGTIYYGETVNMAVQRVAGRELGIIPTKYRLIGLMEYPELIAIGYGDPKGLAYLITEFDGEIDLNFESTSAEWFKSAPENLIKDQKVFLENQGLI